MPDYLPIAEHGVIGDLHSAALVATDGTIDWYCCPRFDSPSVFASILDHKRGGFYRIAPANPEGCKAKQLYFPDTNVLITRFLTPDGVGEVEDFMPIQGRSSRTRQAIVRRVMAVRGSMRFRLVCEPRFDYGRAEHSVELHEQGAVMHSPGLTLALQSTIPIDRLDGGVHAEFELQGGESATFVLEPVSPGHVPTGVSEAWARHSFEETVAYWRRWLSSRRTAAAGGRW